jgi:hypothetical protein
VERALQKQARQEMRALQEQARQDMRAGEQVIAYPVRLAPLSHYKTFLITGTRKKIPSSVAEAALGIQASGSWAWLSNITAQSSGC